MEVILGYWLDGPTYPDEWTGVEASIGKQIKGFQGFPGHPYWCESVGPGRDIWAPNRFPINQVAPKYGHPRRLPLW